MLRDSQKDRTILCRFDPTETGLYQIFVKWSGVDVPGSPFQVYIVDSQHELMRVMQGQIPAHYQGSTLNRSVYNSEYSSWREEDNMMRMWKEATAMSEVAMTSVSVQQQHVMWSMQNKSVTICNAVNISEKNNIKLAVWFD